MPCREGTRRSATRWGGDQLREGGRTDSTGLMDTCVVCLSMAVWT